MQDQWFLDLEGVRSGPYQTSEIINLIAEGEVLPHHMISAELKGSDWMNILQWRLNQTKTMVSQPNSTQESEPMIILEEKKPAPVEPPPIISTPTPTSQTPPVEKKLEKESSKNIANKISPVQDSAPRGDPMLDMFDIIQTTKQKREAKSHQAHTPTTHTQPTSAKTSSNKGANNSGMSKTLLLAIGVTLIGFALGQYFQQKSTTTEPTKAAASPTPSPTPVQVKSTPIPNPAPKKTQILDRSNEKITIKSRVAVPQNTPIPTPTPPQDIQELRDLKKELQELRELKRRNGEVEESFDEGDIDPAATNPPLDAQPTDSNKDIHY